ncbi:MAG: hypothetical protein AB7L76_11775 [Burkholderiaceae bacterium]
MARRMAKRAPLRWRLTAVCLLSAALNANAHGYLENPVAGSTESGIALVSGWHCTAKEIRVYIDGVDIGRSGIGSIRNDTASICGQANTGFSLLYNFNKLTPGSHTLAVYADGAHLETREFTAVQSGGVEFLEGINRDAELLDFPQVGFKTTLRWSQAKQNFFVVESAAEGSDDQRMRSLRDREFIGFTYYEGLGAEGDATKFTFSVRGEQLHIVRAADLADRCFLRGDYSFTASGISSTGTYTCEHSESSGTYRASSMQVNSLGVYTGKLTLSPSGSGKPATEVHAAVPATSP